MDASIDWAILGLWMWAATDLDAIAMQWHVSMSIEDNAGWYKYNYVYDDSALFPF